MAKKAVTGVVDTNKYKYGTLKVRDADGKLISSTGNGDSVQRAMIGLDHAALVVAMNKNGLAEKLGKYAKNAENNGLFRMSLGNSLRALVRNGTTVKIGRHEVKTLKQHVPVEVAKTAKPAKKVKAKKPGKVKRARSKAAPVAAVQPEGAAQQ